MRNTTTIEAANKFLSEEYIKVFNRKFSMVKELSEALSKEAISMQTESRTRGQSESYGQNIQRLSKECATIDSLDRATAYQLIDSVAVH